eukprot:scaffold42784_cov214-Amphora_coffeaeformis.AAC.3
MEATVWYTFIWVSYPCHAATIPYDHVYSRGCRWPRQILPSYYNSFVFEEPDYGRFDNYFLDQIGIVPKILF